jgi:RimJ/RimL family protein N-acetyltransferase
MDLLAYLHLQLRLEGKEILAGCLLRQVEMVPDEDVPLMLIAQLADGESIADYDERISPDLQRDLQAGLTTIRFPEIGLLRNVVEKVHLRFEMGHYKTYVLRSRPASEADVLCLSKDDPKVMDFGFDGFAQHVYAVERNGRLVSACVSTRENDRCGEAWVYTAPEYRGQGFAQKVVKAWARSLMEAGKVPFYSHKIENAASAHLAEKLGLQPVFEEILIAHADES